MMKILLGVCLVVALMREDTNAAIIASVNDFVVDCGTTYGGPVNITYINPLPGSNTVVKIYSRGNLATCFDDDSDGDNVYTIADVRGACTIANPSSKEYQVEITLQEFPLVIQVTDPKFLFNCIYVPGNPMLTITDSAGNGAGVTPTIQNITATVAPDQTYTLELLDAANNPTPVAKYGDTITVRIYMSGFDHDEKGVQIKQMNLLSGSVSLPVIDNYCVMNRYRPLFGKDGFETIGGEARFTLTLFALEGSGTDVIQFDLEGTICSAACDGSNCGDIGKRKRRATDTKTMKMSTKLYVLPKDVNLSSSSLSTGDGSNGGTCMQSLGFIVTVAVLAVLLLVAMVTVVFMFITRRRELQKQGA